MFITLYKVQTGIILCVFYSFNGEDCSKTKVNKYNAHGNESWILMKTYDFQKTILRIYKM
jgi:hypothetical protein